MAQIDAAVARGSLPAKDWKTGTGEHPVEAGGNGTCLAIVESRCIFYGGQAGRCAVHRTLGHDALPLACRQFPRVSVRDPRGVSVTLSHYCPTAASLLEDQGTAVIVETAGAFPSAGEYEGLDACEMPPLLRPDMAMDWESWWEFEQRAVGLIAAEPSTTRALRRLGGIIEVIRPWRTSDEPLIARIISAFSRAEPEEPVEPVEPEEPRTIRNFVCAHAFANWTAHLGLGLRTWLRSLEAAHDLARRVGVRQADLTLRHVSDPKRLADQWSLAEAAIPRRSYSSAMNG